MNINKNPIYHNSTNKNKNANTNANTTNCRRAGYAAIISVFVFAALFAAPSSAGGMNEGLLFSDECIMSPGFDMEIELHPDISKSDSMFARDQELSFSVNGEPGSELGVWLYKAGIGNPTKNVFVNFTLDENGEIPGEGQILDSVASHKLPSGKYYIYFVDGDSDLVKEGFFPDSSEEFEERLTGNNAGNSYVRTVLIAEVPWVRYDMKTFPDIKPGEPLELTGTTNLEPGRTLLISIGPTAFDDPYFKDQIIERVTVMEGDPYNYWGQTIDTSELGPGEYMALVEGSDVETEMLKTFNVYDENYNVNGVNGGGEEDLLVKTYSVDPDSKEISTEEETAGESVPVKPSWAVNTEPPEVPEDEETPKSPIEPLLVAFSAACAIGVFGLSGRKGRE